MKKKTKEISLREKISKEYLGGYRDYLEQAKKFDFEPVNFEHWANWYSFKSAFDK